MKYWLILFILLNSTWLGWWLDKVRDFSVRPGYWALGLITGFIVASILAMQDKR